MANGNDFKGIIEDQDTYKHFPNLVMEPLLKDLTSEQIKTIAFYMEWEIQNALHDQKAKFNKMVEEENKLLKKAKYAEIPKRFNEAGTEEY